MWEEIYKRICQIRDNSNSDILFFRGHGHADWKLLPGLGRQNYSDRDELEGIAYEDFRTKAGILIPENSTDWNCLFLMQHHGLPTRLLDWSDNFAVALYFALKDADSSDACIWVLNPFELNKLEKGSDELLSTDQLGFSYQEILTKKSNKNVPDNVVAISPLRHQPRIFSQKAGFTFHVNLSKSLEELYPSALLKVDIPESAFDQAWEFLDIAGISEFSLFPDLDGLARELLINHFND